MGVLKEKVVCLVMGVGVLSIGSQALVKSLYMLLRGEGDEPQINHQGGTWSIVRRGKHVRQHVRARAARAHACSTRSNTQRAPIHTERDKLTADIASKQATASEGKAGAAHAVRAWWPCAGTCR